MDAGRGEMVGFRFSMDGVGWMQAGVKWWALDLAWTEMMKYINEKKN